MSMRRRASRRSLLGGLAAIAGLAGSGIATRLGVLSETEDQGATLASLAPSGTTAAAGLSTLYIDQYTLLNPNHKTGRQRGDQSLLRGTLRNADGARAGEIFSSAVTMPGPVDPESASTARMETQVIHLLDGTITAIAVVYARADVPNTYTIVGGTGSYARARGTYSFDNNPNVARPDGRSAIRFEVAV